MKWHNHWDYLISDSFSVGSLTFLWRKSEIFPFVTKKSHQKLRNKRVEGWIDASSNKRLFDIVPFDDNFGNCTWLALMNSHKFSFVMNIKFKPAQDTFGNSTFIHRDNFMSIHFGEAHFTLPFLTLFILSVCDYERHIDLSSFLTWIAP